MGAIYTPSSRGHSNGKKKRSHYYVCNNRIKSKKLPKPGEKQRKAPRVNAKVLEEMVTDDLLNLLFHPFRSLKRWTDVKRTSTQKERRLDRKRGMILAEIISTENKIINLNKGLIRRESGPDSITKTRIIEGMEESINELETQLAKLEDEKIEIEKELDGLKTEIKKVQNVTRYSEKIRRVMYKSNKVNPPSLNKVGRQYVSDMREKIRNIPFGQKKKLIEYIVPPGYFLRIDVLRREDWFKYHYPGIERRYKINWQYFHEGPLDIDATIGAVKKYANTGEIPDYRLVANDRYY